MVAIIVSIVIMCIDSTRESREARIRGAKTPVLDALEAVAVGLFTVEFFGRLLTVTSAPLSDQYSAEVFGSTDDELDDAFAGDDDPGYADGAGTASDASRSEATGAGGGGFPADSSAPAQATAAGSQSRAGAKAPANAAVQSVMGGEGGPKASPLVAHSSASVGAIAPFYTELVVMAVDPDQTSGNGVALSVLRVLRVARVLRVLKLGRRSSGFAIISKALAKSAYALFLTFFFVFLGIVLFGAIMFYSESGEFDQASGLWLRPDTTGTGVEESPFSSIMAAFWFCIVTASTTGYGDLVPTGLIGKVVASCLQIAGIIVLALPISIIGSNFTTVYREFEGLRGWMRMGYSKEQAKQLVLAGHFPEDVAPGAIAAAEGEYDGGHVHQGALGLAYDGYPSMAASPSVGSWSQPLSPFPGHPFELVKQSNQAGSWEQADGAMSAASSGRRDFWESQPVSVQSEGAQFMQPGACISERSDDDDDEDAASRGELASGQVSRRQRAGAAGEEPAQSGWDTGSHNLPAPTATLATISEAASSPSGLESLGRGPASGDGSTAGSAKGSPGTSEPHDDAMADSDEEPGSEGLGQATTRPESPQRGPPAPTEASPGSGGDITQVSDFPSMSFSGQAGKGPSERHRSRASDSADSPSIAELLARISSQEAQLQEMHATLRSVLAAVRRG
ncbi:hypothetical protein FNF31_03118 [Cafeteria roenbergensis]|uniref:Ion transport domain-containing protein n=1 Tax=Cafeteria roenbergensis TaxID=33653 RepID=A0A5A8DDX6_CAFRO|nr:hypothetical protein FNF31_03118 [Cafeteria roenbergensis]